MSNLPTRLAQPFATSRPLLAATLLFFIPLASLTPPHTALGADAIPATTQPVWPPPLSPLRPDDFEAQPTDYTIGRHDLLQVSITGLPEPDAKTVKNVRVNAQGAILLGEIGTIAAAGRTPHQLEKDIAASLKQSRNIANASATVTVIEARQNTFSILGTVTRPGQYAIDKPTLRLRDALSLGGTLTADPEAIYVIRATPAPTATPATTQPAKRVLRIPLPQLTSHPDAWNIVIRPGDTLIVAPPERTKE